MEVIKIFLLFFISIACSLSQKIEENQEVAEPRVDLNRNYPPNSKGNCHGKFCREIKSKYAKNKRCSCFPLNNDNTPVLEYLTNDSQETIERTVVYIYTVGKKTAIYIPNLHKQSLFTDLTFDDGDVLRPLRSHNVNLLTAIDELPQENEDQSRRTNAHITINENRPINKQNLQKSISTTSSERINKKALKHILKDDLPLLASYEYLSSQDFDGIGESNLYDGDDSKSVFGILYPDEDDEYFENVDEPVLVSKPGGKNVFVDDTVGSQEKLYLNPGAVREPSVFVSVENGLDPIMNELFLHEVNEPKNMAPPFNTAGPNFLNIGLKPNEQQTKFPYKGFGYDEDDNQSKNVFDLEPLNQAGQVLNINGPLAIPNLHSLHNADRPVKVFESKPSEEIIDEHGKAPKIDYGLNLSKDYFPSYHNSKPQKTIELNSNENKKLVENIAKPQNLFGDNHLQPQNGFGFGSPSNTLPVDVYESTHSKELNLNSIYEPQRKVEIEIEEDKLASVSLIKHRPDISCSSGICKLHIYCSRYECPKYLQSLSKLHTSIHKHPYLKNTFVAINNVGGNVNSTDSQLKSFFNLIGLENSKNKIQNIRGVQLEEENPNNYLSHVQRKQVPRSIPMSFDPLFSTLKEGPAIQSLPFSNSIKDQLVEFYPENKQILSTQILNPPQYRGIYFPMPHHDQHNNIKITPVTPDKKDPSQNLKIIPVTPEKKDSPKYRGIYFPIPHHDQKPNNIKITPVTPATPEKKDSPKYRGIYFPIPHHDQKPNNIKITPVTPATPEKKDSSKYRGIYFPMSHDDQLVTPEKKDSLKDLLLLPSKIHHEGMKTVADLIPGLSLRRNNVVEEDVPDEIEVPVDEEDIKIKIIGGQPAVSSGTPMQIKARLGDV